MALDYFFERSGMMQKVLAEKAGVPRPTISKLRNRKMTVGIAIMAKIARALNLELTKMLDVGKRLSQGLPIYEEYNGKTSHVKIDAGLYLSDQVEVQHIRGGQVIPPPPEDPEPKIIEMVQAVLAEMPELDKWLEILNKGYDLNDETLKSRARQAIIDLLKSSPPDPES